MEAESNDIGMDGSRELQRRSSDRQTQAEVRGVAVGDGSDKVWIRLHFMFVVRFDFISFKISHLRFKVNQRVSCSGLEF